MAASGKFEKVVKLEIALHVQGHPTHALKDAVVRTELQLLIDEAILNQGDREG